MLNKLCALMARYEMVHPGDTVVCALSGGADSVALVFALYLLKEKLGICPEAAHFNHGLRGAESDRDEAFVKEFCRQYEIPLHLGGGAVTAGKKGLEAAAREARYAFLNRLPGKIATAHTADDNAETVLMHLVRGTGLKGLGAIAPVSGKLIRPMLLVTRQEVLEFLEEYHLNWVEDSSNGSDDFLRNRLRHHVMPLLKSENPRLGENLSAMALRLRQDEEALNQPAVDSVEALRAMHPAHRSRALGALLERFGVKEPSAEHIALAESLVFSHKPSAKASFPGDIIMQRDYDRLYRLEDAPLLAAVELNCPGLTRIPEWGMQVVCTKGGGEGFSVTPQGKLVLRARQPGDTMRLSGGTKSLKKLFIDRKIPAAQRNRIPVIADEAGVVGVYRIGPNLDRVSEDRDAIQIQMIPIK